MMSMGRHQSLFAQSQGEATAQICDPGAMDLDSDDFFLIAEALREMSTRLHLQKFFGALFAMKIFAQTVRKSRGAISV